MTKPNTIRKTASRKQARPVTLADAPLHRVLEAEQDSTTQRPKGQRTRARLMAAAAFHLEQDGFVNLRVTDICARAGVSQGTFYVYFDNKTTISTALLSDFNERGIALLRSQGPHADDWAAIRKPTGALTRLYRHNPGLMRCLWQINDETPEFGEILRQGNAVWMQAVARSMLRRSQGGSSDLALAVAYAMAAMVDQFLVQRYVTCDPILAELMPDEQSCADLLSALWYRAVWGALPPGIDQTRVAGLAAFHLSPDPRKDTE